MTPEALHQLQNTADPQIRAERQAAFQAETLALRAARARLAGRIVEATAEEAVLDRAAAEADRSGGATLARFDAALEAGQARARAEASRALA